MKNLKPLIHKGETLEGYYISKEARVWSAKTNKWLKCYDRNHVCISIDCVRVTVSLRVAFNTAFPNLEYRPVEISAATKVVQQIDKTNLERLADKFIAGARL